uniref:Right handed beta helix domain-containing protein n=1 Tax=Amphimedon queenslandica TaxID=400682 RepID=A0A1X7SWF9_AMPQE
MSLLLVVVLLFFSSSCSVSSGQYYVSDDCSSVTQSPCNPLSVYAGNMSQYNNTIFYFIGTTNIRYYDYDVTMTAVKNVTLHGLDQSPSINCNQEVYISSIAVQYSDNVTISNISFSDCTVNVDSSNNFTITNSVFASSFGTNYHYHYLVTSNAFDLKISSVFSAGFSWNLLYSPLPACSSELLQYSLTLTNVIFIADSGIKLVMHHGTTYNVSIIFDHVQCCTKPGLQVEGLFYFLIMDSSFHDVNDGPGLFIDFYEYSKSNHCSYPSTQLTSTLLIEDSQFYNNKQGLKINSDVYLIEAVNYHIIIKSCLIYDNINEGLAIDGKFFKSLQIDIIDTELIGNGGNKIMNSNVISLSNVNVANSTYTGLSLMASVVTINNDLIFMNNTGVVGGGLAINDSSQLILTSSANLEFIDNHASYKGGGIYSEESTSSYMILKAPNIPLTLINNSAGLVGGDLYGYYMFILILYNYQFNLTNPNISSASDATGICFCDPHTTTSYENCLQTVSDQHNYPGQALKFNVALFGSDYFGSPTPTDGTVQILNNTKFLLNRTYIPNTCSLIEYTPKLTQSGYQSYIKL